MHGLLAALEPGALGVSSVNSNIKKIFGRL
jgi:hypothetical protein